MSDSSSDQALSDQVTDLDQAPDQAVVSSQHAQPLTPQNVQGSAMLDAHQATGNPQPQGEPIDAAIATNFSSTTATGDPKTAGASGEMGTYSTDQPTSEKGSVNLQNNPDVPNQGSNLHGTLPDTDSVQLPNDPETNLPT